MSTLDSAPRRAGRSAAEQEREALLLTILLHPDGRGGEVAVLPDLTEGHPREISRKAPLFTGGAGERSLEHPRVSRRPLWLFLREGELVVRVGADPIWATLDGQPITSSLSVPLERLRGAGAVLGLGATVLLWLRWGVPSPPVAEAHGIVGVSPAAQVIRAEVERAARSPAPALIRGESGVGKELVARAIHGASPRAAGPLVAVNMAAISPSMAASELFGHGRGAFTGAATSRRGYFEQAHHGTLFLDEIGETPSDVQPQLLRVLDEGEIQPVGQAPRRVDVRLVSATDADLDALLRERRFRPALFHRISGTVIGVPPLRARRVDIPLLLHRFLAEELRRFGAERLLEAAGAGPPWLPCELVTRLMSWHFPGNVRELRHIALDIAAGSYDQAAATLPAALQERMNRVDDALPSNLGALRGRRRVGVAGGLSPEAVRRALEESDWVVTRAASALGVARNTLLEAMAGIPDLRQARDLPVGVIRGALDAAGGSIEDAARELRVSAHGLRLRLNTLGWHASG